MFISPTLQKCLSIKRLKDPSKVPNILKDIEFYRAVPWITAKNISGNLLNHKPVNQSQKAAFEWCKKFAAYQGDKAAGLFITGQPGLNNPNCV